MSNHISSGTAHALSKAERVTHTANDSRPLEASHFSVPSRTAALQKHLLRAAGPWHSNK